VEVQIETKELSKWFGEVVALNNVSIQIPSGVVGLLGPNGAGKSTFIKLALGLYRPSRGEIRILGEKRAIIFMSFQGSDIVLKWTIL
jgi:ABC-2 type transport system ATP-binding protein